MDVKAWSKNIRTKYPYKEAFILYGIIILALFIIKPTTWWMFGLSIAIITLIYSVYSKIKIGLELKLDLIKDFVKTFAVSVIFWLFWRYVGAYSIVLAIILIAIYKMYRQKDLIKETVKFGSDWLGEIYEHKRSRKNNRTEEKC